MASDGLFERIEDGLNTTEWKAYNAQEQGIQCFYKDGPVFLAQVLFHEDEAIQTIFEKLKTPQAISGWCPFLHSIKQTGKTYTGMILSPIQQIFALFSFRFIKEYDTTRNQCTVVLKGTPTIAILLKQEGDKTAVRIIVAMEARPTQLYNTCYLFYKYMHIMLHSTEERRLLLELEKKSYARYGEPPLRKFIHESQRVRITASEDEILLQADICIPLRLQTFFDYVLDRDGLRGVLSESKSITKGEYLSMKHLSFSPMIQVPVKVDVVMGSVTACEWMAVVFKSVVCDECHEEHTNTITFKESCITFKPCGEDSTRVRYNIILGIPIAQTIAHSQREKFLTNLVAPILYYLASMASPSIVNSQSLYSAPNTQGEMSTIESMSTLLLNSITMSKTSQRQVIRLCTLPDSILLRIFKNLSIESLRNVQQTCKNLYTLLVGNLSQDTWKFVFHKSCFYNGKSHAEETFEVMVEASRLLSLWKNKDIRPVVFTHSTAAITAVCVDRDVFVGDSSGKCSRYRYPQLGRSDYCKKNVAACGMRYIRDKLYVGYTNGTINVVGETENVRKFEPFGHVEFDADGSHLVYWNNDVKYCDLETGDVVQNFSLHSSQITQVRTSEQLVVSSGMDKKIFVVDTRSQAPAFLLSGHGGGVRAFDFSGDYKIVSCGEERAAIQWDLRNGQIIKKADIAVVPTCIATHNMKVVYGGTNGQIAFLWNKTELGDRRYLFRVQGIPTAISIDDASMAVGTSEGFLHIVSFKRKS